ncbi:MAG: peptide chain release factor-like protein [Deltaproteobacteria bacterium]|nr:peptide chain release factor-like protein [Deltaproteobacteria bacterium]
MSDFPVSQEKTRALEEKMARFGVREEDLDESFVRSSGHGGQKVNKTSSCVQLVHRPTGITVKCQQERSQALNRYLARRILVDKIEEKVLGERSERRKAMEKIRRQKRKRSKRAKEKMLKAKHHRSAIKATRKPPSDND